LSRSFFTPLPRHLWEGSSPEELLSAEHSARLPVGWGPYVLDEWAAGDHITLHKNPNYFRSAEGLPAFDRLVFRFVSPGQEAIDALLAGECDLADASALPSDQRPGLFQYQEQGRLKVAVENGPAWEHADFGIAASDLQKPVLFQPKEVRQAVAMCIDRQSIAQSLFQEPPQVPNSYVPQAHPIYASEAKQYPFDPPAASVLLDAAGWKDGDNDLATPRVALGVPGVPDGTPFTFTYLAVAGSERELVAGQIQASLAQCGIQMQVSLQDGEGLFAPGPDGPVFGRRFDMAQFGWTTSLEPPCFLYTSSEIPGSYPQYPKGWGGANASGYSSEAFDQACLKARFSSPDSAEYQDAHRKAQIIFAEDLPAIPLYLHQLTTAMRTELCGAVLDPSSDSALWNLEAFNEGEACQ
jgi:peptide/nickel transport system substrate-binding protein